MAKNTDKAFGQCLAPVSSLEEAIQILKDNGLNVVGRANEKQVKAAAVVVQQIRLLNGGVCNATAVDIRFNVNKRFSDAGLSRGRTVTFGRNHTSGNCSHIGHELGHMWFNNSGNLGAYSTEVGRCNISNSYGNGKLSENAAEAFSFFVTNPDHLRKSRCGKRAIAFFERHFKNANKYAVCDRSMLAAAISGNASLTQFADASAASSNR